MKRIVLLGMPNTGKSTYFNRLTGASARVGNWPGVTVDLLSAKILVGGAMAEVVDLPGIYDLHGFSDDEKVVRHFLEDNPVDLAVLLVNAVQVERQLSDPAIYADREMLTRLSREQKELTPIAAAFRAWQQAEDDCAQAQELLTRILPRTGGAV